VELKDQVRELRAQGKSPKEIARALKVSPSAVAPLVRAIAAESAHSGESELIGCWVNIGWSEGLTVDPARGWTDEAPESGAGGMISVLVARRHSWDRLSVSGYLADVYCLGVKNTFGPDVMSEIDFRKFREYFYGEYAGYQEAPLDLAKELVFGSIDYAGTLGFEAQEEFEPVTGVLGTWEGRSAITFGREGKPFYMQGPHDDSAKVLRVLRRTLAEDGFDYILTAPSPAS
jgi:hypothetical protein